MDDNRPKRRRELTPKEQKALEKQRQRERELARKQARMDARYREEARKQARKNGTDSHIVVEIPARPQTPPDKKRTKRKSIPNIIEKETDKRVRDMPPSDHKDGYYVNEVEVRKAQARRQRDKRRQSQPKPVSPKKRRAMRIAVYTSIIVAVIAVGVVLSLTVLFKTESIQVKGNKYYDDNTIVELAGVSEGENIFMATMFGNKDSISDNLPYIKSAKISFKIPNSLIITVTNETAYFALKSDGYYYLISEKGRILEKTEERPKKLMFVNAPSLKSAEVGDYLEFKKDYATTAVQEISESLVENGYGDITSIDIKKMSDVTITYDDRIIIRLGLPDDIDYKIRTAFTIINTKLDPNNAGTIQGILNVSECNTTKKSYFNECDINDEDATETTTATQSTTESTTVRTTYVSAATTQSESATESSYYEQYTTEAYE